MSKWLLGIAAISLMISASAFAELPNNARPNFPEEHAPEYGSICTPTHMSWQSNYAHDRHSMDIRPDETTDGRSVTISCKTSHHTVKLLVNEEPPNYGRCGASMSGYLTIYLDGIKVRDKLDWGDWSACMAGQDVSLTTVTRLILNDEMSLSICHDVNDEKSYCELDKLAWNNRVR